MAAWHKSKPATINVLAFTETTERRERQCQIFETGRANSIRRSNPEVLTYNAPHEDIEMMHRATDELEGAALKAREVMNREEKNTHQEEIAHPAKAEPRVRGSARATSGESVMNSGVRIIKRGRDDCPKSLQLGRNQKTERQIEREIVSTVKRWITEREQRRNIRESVHQEMLIKFAE